MPTTSRHRIRRRLAISSAPGDPLAVRDRGGDGSAALDDLRFIRRTMESAASFTAVPGWGMVAIGGTALIASAACAFLRSTPGSPIWMSVWLADAAVALAIALWTMSRKARRAGIPLFSAPGRRFAASFVPPMLAAAVLTLVVDRGSVARPELIAGTWLVLYGAAVITGGAFSVRAVPAMGAVFMLLGGAALLLPQFAFIGMALGFGLAHIVFGIVVAKNYGG
jgi:hypothetical protein